jgi:hypothetical protein
LNTALINILNAAMNSPVTPALALAICQAAQQMPTLVHPSTISRIMPEWSEDCVFSLEKMEDIQEEIYPLHLAHWNETEEHRHGLPFNPAYATFIRYEQAGRYVLFTLRMGGRLVGNCAMYLDMSAHTQTLIATEDTLYLLPEARSGQRGRRFIFWVEEQLKQLGAREIHITVKTVNKAERLFRLLGYKHVENGLVKLLEDENHVQQ